MKIILIFNYLFILVFFITIFICILNRSICLLIKTNKSNEDIKKEISFYHDNKSLLNEINLIINNNNNNKELILNKVNIIEFSDKLKDNLYNNDKYKAYIDDYIKYLYFIDISKTPSANNNQNKKNVYIVGGEHPRELITVETLLQYLKKLTDNSIESKFLLDNYNFRILLNSNPIIRDKIIKNPFSINKSLNISLECSRTNIFNVDINRNWDYYFNTDIDSKEVYCGKTAFSEIETQFIKESVVLFNTSVFITVHSGDLAIMYPYGYHSNFKSNQYNSINKMSNSIGQKLVKPFVDLKNIIDKIKSLYCKDCLIGSANDVLNYQSSGTSIDYLYNNQKIPITLALEIYTNEREFTELNELKEKVKTLKLKENTYKNYRFNQLFKNSKFIKKQQNSNKLNYKKRYESIYNSDKDICFKDFNPLSKDIENVSNIWSNIINKLLNEILLNRKKFKL